MKHPIQKSAGTALKSRIERKQEALSRIDRLKEALSDAIDRVNSLERELQSMNSRLDGFRDDIHESEAKTAVEMRRGQLREELAAAKQAYEGMVGELNHLEKEVIPDCDQPTTLADILPHQDELTTLRANVQRLEAAVLEQRAVIQAADAGIAPDPDRRAERAEILARLVIGEAKSKELDTLDMEISQARELHKASLAEANIVIEPASEAIVGLQDKIVTLRENILELEQMTAFVLEQYLASEIDQSCKRYVEHAQVAKESFIRVVAMEGLLRRVTGQRKREIMPALLILPCPQLDGFRELAEKYDSRVLFDADSAHVSSRIYEAVMAEELERMRADGCELL